jgi:hypothetical protein
MVNLNQVLIYNAGTDIKKKSSKIIRNPVSICAKNIINGKRYVGSSVNLRNRLGNYYSSYCLEKASCMKK